MLQVEALRGALLITMAALAEGLPITRLAGASFKVADIEKARQFYNGILGLEEAPRAVLNTGSKEISSSTQPDSFHPAYNWNIIS